MASEILHEKTDVVIVGAGAGGGVVAKQLAVRGIKCVGLERGDWPIYDENANDELINQRTHAIKSLHGPDRRKFPRIAYRNEKMVKLHNLWSSAAPSIAACVGSGTVTYGAMGWRFMPQDFKLKTLYGDKVKGSALEDWPISYDDLEPYYEQAEYEIGVSGDMKDNPFAPPRKKPFPMPAFEYNWEDKHILIPAMKRLGLHPFPIPMLRNSVRYNGRAACIRNHTCVGYMCPCDAKNGTQNTVIPTALKTGNFELRTNSVAFEVVMEGKRATGVKYFDAQRRAHFQPADAVVVAASSIETVRLLFLSKSKLFPHGLGNQNDMLGRCAHSHIYCGATGLFDEDVAREFGPGATVAFSDFNHNASQKIFAGVLCSEFYQLPWQRSMNNQPNAPRWGAEHKRRLRENYRKVLRLIGPVQEIPMYECRIGIEPRVRDWYGIPVFATLGGRKHPLSLEQTKILTDAAESVLREAGAKTTWKINAKPNLNGANGAGQHQAGSCRMGDDPVKSVVDPNCKIWDTENVWIGDGSVHVSNGGFNPVLTIMALAYRTGENIAKAFGKKA